MISSLLKNIARRSRSSSRRSRSSSNSRNRSGSRGQRGEAAAHVGGDHRGGRVRASSNANATATINSPVRSRRTSTSTLMSHYYKELENSERERPVDTETTDKIKAVTSSVNAYIKRKNRAGSVIYRNDEKNDDDVAAVTSSGVSRVRDRITYPIDISVSIWLVISSCFFLLPAYYAYYTKNLPYYAALSTITTAVSVNHWRNANFGPRRDFDRLVAHISFVIYFVTGLSYIVPRGGEELYLYAIPGCFFILWCFYMSNLLMEQGSVRWLYFHFMFHVFVALEQLLVLRNVNL